MIPDETLLSFNVSILFTSIIVPIALEIIKGKFTKHIEKSFGSFLKINCLIPRDSIILLLDLLLNNCVLFSKGSSKNSYKVQQCIIRCFLSPQTFALSTLLEFALGPKFPIACLWWKDMWMMLSSIVKKTQVDTLLNHFNAAHFSAITSRNTTLPLSGLHINFTMGSPVNDNSIPFPDAKSLLKEDRSI